MLTPRRVTAGVGFVVLVTGLLGAPSAHADDKPGGGVTCPPTKLDCDVNAEAPGVPTEGKKPSSGGGGGGKQKCEIDGKTVPCSRDDIGAFNSADKCYWDLIDPQPESGSEDWGLAIGIPDDWKAGDPGKLYNVICPGVGREVRGGLTFAENDPTEAAVDPAVLAQQAVDSMTLRGADIGITPNPDGKGLVGMPVWMWTARSAETYGPNTATASAGGITVTATAKVTKIGWKMGDGASVTCTKPGTPYKAAYGKRSSPDCGHRYTQPSSTQDAGKYHVEATSTWTIEWTGGGQSGQLTETRDSDVDITVLEAQVLN